MNASLSRAREYIRRFPAILLVAFALLAVLAFGRTEVEFARLPAGPGNSSSLPAVSGPEHRSPAVDSLWMEHAELEGRLRALMPDRSYLVVDRGNNRIFLRRGDSVLVDAAASTGSGSILKEIGGQERSWVFDTPGGRFQVLARREDPVWTKPDWAFLEVGEPIPERPSERKDYGSLGEYALDLGDGYMIHGTLYERLLGRSVTHGCVRVGRDPLRAIARGTRVGTPVFIF